jgi:hypothetical protein
MTTRRDVRLNPGFTIYDAVHYLCSGVKKAEKATSQATTVEARVREICSGKKAKRAVTYPDRDEYGYKYASTDVEIITALTAPNLDIIKIRSA